MGGEGHMLDMIRRLKDGKEASRLRRERRNDKLGRLRRNNDPYLLPNTTPEEMERIIKDSEKKKEKDSEDSRARITPLVRCLSLKFSCAMFWGLLIKRAEIQYRAV